MALIHDLALMQHDKAIGMRIAQVVGQPDGIARYGKRGGVQLRAWLTRQDQRLIGMLDAHS